MPDRYELWSGDNNCDLCCMSEEPDGDWVAYDDYAELRKLFDGLCADIAALDPVPRRPEQK